MGSMAALMGASWGGAKTMTATSGLGFSLMQEHIGFAVITETPLVIVDVMRCGPASGVVAEPMQGDVMQANWGHNGSVGVIALAPSSVQECFDLTIESFNLAEKYRSPVILLSDARLANLREKVSIPPIDSVEATPRKAAKKGEKNFFLAAEGVAPMPLLGDGHRVIVACSSHDEQGNIRMNAENHKKLVNRLNDKLALAARESTKIETGFMDDAEVAVLSYGISARGVENAVKRARSEGLKVGFVRLISIWPFNEDAVKKALGGAKDVIVVELNKGQIFNEVRRALGGEKQSHLVWDIGQLVPPEVIYDKIRQVIR
jgi:2-oxoglutarate ferredoxin oxidoreductase subunit alpha